MARWRPVFCIVFGLGHRWQTQTDDQGSVTSCRRCGRLRHARTEDLELPVELERNFYESKTIENTKYMH
jgi:hypothetical protein